MNAEVLTIGTELLLGQILDTNSLYLGKKLAEVGVNLYYKTTVGDNIKRAVEALKIAASRADLIIITGGLGPTVDDITRQAVCEYTGRKLVVDEKALSVLTKRFSMRGITMTDNNKTQAYFPEGALIIENNNGTAPGFIVEENTVILVAMPGVPSEMYPMMEMSILPYILKKQGNAKHVIKSKSIKVIGLGESVVDDKIQDLFRESNNPTIGVYAHIGETEIRLTAKAEDTAKALNLIDALKEKIYARLKDNIYGENEETLEKKVAEFLINQNLTVSTAESCTAGLLAHRLTNIPGSSVYYTGGINAYSNEVKIDILGVSPDIINKFGAVSEECAAEMAVVVSKKFKTNIGISITGVAGPDGGTDEKPVGLVYIGICIKGVVIVIKNNFPGTRENIRLRSAQNALFLLYTQLKNMAEKA